MSTSGPDTIRILITSDNHVGYNEQDPIRRDDSWKTFHEIMSLARTEDVDMVLQAGDLFHVNRPSRNSLYQVITSLRENCMGDRPCELELLSDPSLSTRQPNPDYLNYEDPNYNVSVPVFSISGNHDDSGGEASLCPNDVLAATALINHFGVVKQNDAITVAPILLRKGSTNLALYGLANVRDTRLFQTFVSGNVEFLRPKDGNDWFSLMAVHQNRTSHIDTSYLPTKFLPAFLNMIVWGHEHECIPEPEMCVDKGFDILQVGSSVATSLCEAETKPKYAFVLCVTGTRYVLEKHRLKTVRPFRMKTVVLSQTGIAPGVNAWKEISRYLNREIEGMIASANVDWLTNNAQTEEDPQATFIRTPPLPLIRLRVEYSGGYEVQNSRRFSNQYVDRVANINDVVLFYKKKDSDETLLRMKKGKGREGTPDVFPYDHPALENVKVQKLVEDCMGGESLSMLSLSGLGEAMADFVDKDDKFAISSFVRNSIELQTEELMKIKDLDETNIMEHIERLKKREPKVKDKTVLPPEVLAHVIDVDALFKGPRGNYVNTVTSARGVPAALRGRGGSQLSRGVGSERLATSSSTTSNSRGIVISNTSTFRAPARVTTASMTTPKREPQPGPRESSSRSDRLSDPDEVFQFSQPFRPPVIDLCSPPQVPSQSESLKLSAQEVSQCALEISSQPAPESLCQSSLPQSDPKASQSAPEVPPPSASVTPTRSIHEPSIQPSSEVLFTEVSQPSLQNPSEMPPQAVIETPRRASPQAGVASGNVASGPSNQVLGPSPMTRLRERLESEYDSQSDMHQDCQPHILSEIEEEVLNVIEPSNETDEGLLVLESEEEMVEPVQPVKRATKKPAAKRATENSARRVTKKTAATKKPVSRPKAVIQSRAQTAEEQGEKAAAPKTRAERAAARLASEEPVSRPNAVIQPGATTAEEPGEEAAAPKTRAERAAARLARKTSS